MSPTPAGLTAPTVMLWDFGDTLADQTWMRAAPPGVPEWTDVWVNEIIEAPSVCNPWMTGELSVGDIGERMGASLPMTASEIVDHMAALCRDITLFPAAFAAAEQHRLPQAIVTVNPDVFSLVVVAHYELESMFDTIVTSWEERTLDKVELCDAALDRLGRGHSRRDSLLIDNTAENTEAWMERGGLGYHFVGDDAFASDMTGTGPLGHAFRD